MRKILIALGAVVAIAAAAAVLLMSNLDSLIKTAIEEAGSRVAGVPVRVAKVEISLKDGKGRIAGLTVGNPGGFKTPTAFSLGEIAIALDTASVTGNPVVIRDISVTAPEVTYELGAGGSNVDAIQKNVQSFAGAGGGKAKAEAAPQGGKEDGKKLVIDHLVLRDGKVTLATPLPGGKATGAMGEIKLSNIGRAGGGATAAEVATQVLDALSKSALRTVTNLGVGSVVDAVGGTAAGGLGQIKGLLGR